jgi:hypothetical protein
VKLEKLKQEVEELTPEEIKQFSIWFEARMADMWDEQIERDAKAGKLDSMLQEARENYRAGNCTDL